MSVFGIDSGLASDARAPTAVRDGYRHGREVAVRAAATRFTSSAETDRSLARLARLLSEPAPAAKPLPPGHYLDIVI